MMIVDVRASRPRVPGAATTVNEVSETVTVIMSDPLIEALTNVLAALKSRGSDGSRTSSLDVRRHGYDTTDDCGNVERAYECSQYSGEKSDDGYGSGPTHVRIESTTENEHRVATNGTLNVIRGMELSTPDGINQDLFHGTTTLSNKACSSVMNAGWQNNHRLLTAKTTRLRARSS
ncbi:hypothetical protein PR003_g21488 [Phytophthora rubi]|uniref:Uncharacterized protein n=1 Tax=Phytophthora rubi TaxID=129364 RepID=A0A6A4DH27_9STRA|nr:hypothetical protein PR003_g21488 [Phytophthora rubi]